MLIAGIIKKEEGPWWSATAEALGAFTQGRSIKGAESMLKELVETMVNQPGFRVKVVTAGTTRGVVSVFVESNDPAALAARVLKYQREVNGLTLADVSAVLGMSSRNAYARYEQGKTEPTIGKYSQLLEAVSPGMAVVIGGRRPTKSARKGVKRPLHRALTSR